MSKLANMWKRAGLVAVAGLAVAASGCAEEREPISWVQPDALDKSFFVGKDLQDSSDDPEFYTQGTLVDVGFGASQGGLFTSTYAQPVARMKWVIQQNELLGRLTYERIDGSDGKGAGAASDDGIIVVAYPILSHFDIQKQYNPTTGEQMNVIVENTTDRPWNERQYMRVDWSQNRNVDSYDFDTLSMMGVYGGVKYESMKYYINDPTHPDAPHFSIKEGYFDVTNKAFAKPQMIDLSHLGWGIKEFPACFLPPEFGGGSEPVGNCNPVELTVRQSFRRVENTDYEPMDWDGHRFQAFGAFNEERHGYARNYGLSDNQWRRFISRYNIWERSHYYADPVNMTGAVECFTPETTPVGADPTRDVAPKDGTHDECAVVGNGSRCDQFNQKCTLPYREREVRPMAWYYTQGNNPEYFDGSKWATDEWDVALRMAVQTARYAECVKVGEEAATCEALWPVVKGQQVENEDAVNLTREVLACQEGQAYHGTKNCHDIADRVGALRGYSDAVISVAKMDPMVVLCHSPVEANDPAACGDNRLPEGVTAVQCADAQRGEALWATCQNARQARRGDLRYHQVTVVKEPQTPSPWGIMVDSTDPLTGEKVAASVNVWSHVTDLWSQGVIDTARYIRGELSTEDVTEGTYIEDYAALAAAANNYGALGRIDADSQNQILAAVANTTTQRLEQLRESGLEESSRFQESLQRLHQIADPIRASAEVSSVLKPIYEARRQQAIGTNFEAQLLTKAMQQFAGTEQLPGDLALEFGSPLRNGNPLKTQGLRNLREIALANRGACILNEAPAPLGMTGLVELLEEKFGAFNPNDSKDKQFARAERMRRYLAQRAQYNVMLHEIGHSIGHRHNFVSSSDAWGFRPQYWQLRTEDGKVSRVCQPGTTDGETCVGPRHSDPMTENERTQLLPMFMQSSIMDYAGEPTQDMLGLGVYDFAATRMFYGDVVAVFEGADYKAGTAKGIGMVQKMDNFGGIIGIRPSIGNVVTKRVNFFHYSELQNRYKLINACQKVNPQDFRPANWNTERDGEWHPLADGLIVKVNGEYTRCEQPRVDYVTWEDLRPAAGGVDIDAGWVGRDQGPSIDKHNRVRVPYGFATDGWADSGNLSVFRHDNGADPYELFDFFISQQETNHIFDMYRRGRTTFSVRGAASRNLGRFNEKMRDAAKGLGLYANIYREVAQQNGFDFNTYWPLVANSFQENALASGIAFDHFTRMFSRPQAGPHLFAVRPGIFQGEEGVPEEDGILRARDDFWGDDEVENAVLIPNGATGRFGNISFGGKLLENRLAEDKGEYRSSYTVSAGSYYEKAFTAMLMAESADNFISSSRGDFLDARYRSVSMADLFPDAYRRWMANNLTGDDFIKGVRIAADSAGNPLVNKELFPAGTIGWTTWLPKDGPQTCFAGVHNYDCSSDVSETVTIDPQVGWEQQKFLIAQTLQYLPENQKQIWLNQLWIWEMGADSDPGFENRIEFHDPHGRTYIAKTSGRENIFGKTVEKGISARVLEHANDLLQQAYVTTEIYNSHGNLVGHKPVLNADGQPIIKYDPRMRSFAGDPRDQGCYYESDADYDYSECTCELNRACIELGKFTEVPFFLREALNAYGMGAPRMKGFY